MLYRVPDKELLLRLDSHKIVTQTMPKQAMKSRHDVCGFPTLPIMTRCL
jgi:hypothetical protein